MRGKLWFAWAKFAGLVMLAASTATAQKAPAPVTAPVPSLLLTATKVFISNAGADSGLFPHPFSGGQERGYNQFYAALVGWGRFEVVDDPAKADLVLELQLIAPNGPSNPDKENGAADPLPMFRLNILDRKTHYTLWALTESIEPAIGQKPHDRNFDETILALIVDLKRVVTKGPSGAA